MSWQHMILHTAPSRIPNACRATITYFDRRQGKNQFVAVRLCSLHDVPVAMNRAILVLHDYDAGEKEVGLWQNDYLVDGQVVKLSPRDKLAATSE